MDRRCILVYGLAGVLCPPFCTERVSIGLLLWKSHLQLPPLHGDCCWRQQGLWVHSCYNQCHGKREEPRKAYYEARDGNSPRNEERMWGGNSATDVRCSTQHLSVTLWVALGGVSGPAGRSAGLSPSSDTATPVPQYQYLQYLQQLEPSLRLGLVACLSGSRWLLTVLESSGRLDRVNDILVVAEKVWKEFHLEEIS